MNPAMAVGSRPSINPAEGDTWPASHISETSLPAPNGWQRRSSTAKPRSSFRRSQPNAARSCRCCRAGLRRKAARLHELHRRIGDHAKVDAADQLRPKRLRITDRTLRLPQRADVRAKRDDPAEHQSDRSERGGLACPQQTEDRDQQQRSPATDRELGCQDVLPAALGDLGQSLDPRFDVRNLVGRIAVGHWIWIEDANSETESVARMSEATCGTWIENPEVATLIRATSPLTTANCRASSPAFPPSCPSASTAPA